ncbi:hypothetical protein [Chitinimonas sp.]|uniref:hypothetical protein n=1 Tax=Chitinimonas sp. TaxID=1934313 RepID=UPI0035AE2ACA
MTTATPQARFSASRHSDTTAAAVQNIAHHLSCVIDELHQLDITATRQNAGRDLARLIDEGALIGDPARLEELGVASLDIDRIVDIALGRIGN